MRRKSNKQTQKNEIALSKLFQVVKGNVNQCYSLAISKLFLFEGRDQCENSRVRHYDKQCEGAEIIYGLMDTKMKVVKYKVIELLKQIGQTHLRNNNSNRNMSAIYKQSSLYTQISSKNGLQCTQQLFNCNHFEQDQTFLEENRKFSKTENQFFVTDSVLISSEPDQQQRDQQKYKKRRLILAKLSKLEQDFDEYIDEQETKTQYKYGKNAINEELNNKVTTRIKSKNRRVINHYQ